MKKNVFLTIMIILLITGGISYLIIWWRNKKNAAAGSETETDVTTETQTGPVINTGSLIPTPPIPSSYIWWENNIGHAKFPLGTGSKGVEVVKVQEVLNQKAAQKTTWGLSPITVDGIWGSETNTRFKLFFPGYSLVTQYMFMQEFDPEGEILK